ncbi:hypothetical protein [Arenibacter echinorum]|uniref:Uncharacterized protein n=1 Tax=Arenibacter echinorum TaxID=440515 RepID=A0A327RFP8_9FLAO|nr:hypothetical protein [Arenibacter echinorum]RAJ15719.1 hypothetical protein LV92_00420 [Arenibacter echinorum]
MGKEILIAMNKNLNHIQKTKEALLIQGVEKLKIIGFDNVTIHNILTEEIYILYFSSYLKKISDPKNDNEIIAIKELKSFITKRREI